MADAETLRARGNALYQEGRFEEARTLYADAIAMLTALSSDSDDTRVRIAALYSNRAQTFVQERSFALALHEAVRALEYDPANEKAQLRRLVALENLERFETAFALVERVLDDVAARQQHPALFEYAITARRRLRKIIQQDNVVAKRESHSVGRMVHTNQKLRINFGCLIPSHVVVGEFFDVSVNIGNEFGLFRRDDLPDGEVIQLQCTLRNNPHNALKLAFREPSSSAQATADAAERTAQAADGVVTLNDRGKATFQLAVVSAREDGTCDFEQRSNMAISMCVHDDSVAKWNLLPIVSLPFSLSTTKATQSEESKESDDNHVSSSLGIHCCRPVWLPTLGRELLLAESPGNLGIGGKLWDSCLVLTRYLSRHKHELLDKTVVELGSGLGLVGMFCALLGARHVTLTDMDDVVPLLSYNIRLNFSADQRDVVEVVPHMWGTPTTNLPHEDPDVLVLSDVVYDPEGYAPLVASLLALAPTSKTTIFMAHRSRNPMEHQFFALLAKAFTYDQVDWAEEEEHSVGSQAGATAPAERVLKDVKIFRISRHT